MSEIYTAENPGEFFEKKEKHIPVYEIDGQTVTVTVGAELHPMEAAHFIDAIILLVGGEEIARKDLQPDDEPRAVFEGIENTDGLKVRASCNLHGVWEA